VSEATAEEPELQQYHSLKVSSTNVQ
jgi:hypothetical protein